MFPDKTHKISGEYTTPEEIQERKRARRIKEIEGMKYWLKDEIKASVDDCEFPLAQAMIAFNRLCNEEMDRVK